MFFLLFLLYFIEVLSTVTVKCESEGLYCVNDTAHKNDYYVCSETFQGYRPCSPGTSCIYFDQIPIGFNPCGIPPQSLKCTEKSCESSQDTSDDRSAAIEDKSTDLKELCTKNGYFCVDEEKNKNKFLICSDVFKGFLTCPSGSVCGFKGEVPYTSSPCVTKSLTQQSSSSSQVQDTEVSKDPSKDDSTKSQEETINNSICTSNGNYCVQDGNHTKEYYICSDEYKGYVYCPVGTICGYIGRVPDSDSPCVLESSISVDTTKDISTDDICQSDGDYCVLDGLHDYKYYFCSTYYKGYLPCPLGTKCGYKGKVPNEESPCVLLDSSIEDSSQQIENKYLNFKCRGLGLFCIIDGIHNDQYYQCSEQFNGTRHCPKNTWCKGEQKLPYTESPCVFLEDITWD
ncbi:Cyst wall-specific glycoprotein Jacob family protein [Entamoeba invadens IP1]|uniref:Cyst wall-specific glycoprotein Jacob family protein n=2 Tax=Entamoeba invadens TaxID=33085 RepID=A0A0A1U5L3_ENTIV|nr:Cyst wall-specific glycoprotein Jacob family protein [Entamoeba invadens IP1]ELP87093.1 Cyst wall-specific glycoprotein Jacob family protein [Entamoeba invadens IP1]|eukprot:XP_004253864.1 Cyst wall-specific glycoprotein Jacob family protein [Entamoeba invadens IP1]